MTGARVSIALKPFNRKDDFLVKRALKIHGNFFNVGDTLNKELLTTRRLRQLYETRHIIVAPQDPNKKPDFMSMPTDKVRAWLVSHKAVPRYGAKRASVLSQAEKHWEVYGNGVAEQAGQS